MLSSGADNSKMLKQINSSKMDAVFQAKVSDQNIQNLSGLHVQSFLKQNEKSQYPDKHQISNFDDKFFELQKDLKKSKFGKTFNSNKWDTFAPYSFNKLSSQQKDNVFQKLFQDYNTLKESHNQYVNEHSKLLARMHRIQKQVTKVKNKDKLTGPERVQAYKDQNQQTRHLKQQIKRLHQKIIALTSNKPSQHKANQRPKSGIHHGNTQKAIFPVTDNLKAELQVQKKHVKQLLDIIDDLKRNKLMMDSQMKDISLNRRINDDRPVGSRVGNKNNKNHSDESKFKQYADELLMWKQKYQDLQLCYNKMSEDKDKLIKQTHRELMQLRQSQRVKKSNAGKFDRSNIELFGQDERIRQLQDANQRLQRELKDLARNPLFKDNTQAGELKKKNNQLEAQLHKVKQEIETVRTTSTKYLSELQYKTKQANMLKADGQKLKKQLKEHMEKDIGKKNSTQGYQYDQNDYYRKLLHMVKLEGDDPVWKKYADMSSPSFTVMTQSQLKQIAQSLWRNKLELLAHLEKAQIQLRTNRQTLDSKINTYLREKQSLEEQLRIAKARLDQWVSMDRVHGTKRDFQVFQSKGLKYNDSISVFQDDQDQLKALDHNENFFDLYLGQLNLDQINILRHPQNKIKVPSSIISFLTVDFYNHATQHSNFSEGMSKKLLNNFSFKVEVNSYFLKFLTKNSISIELWSPQGTSTVLFGKGQIWLQDIIASTAKDISNVVRGKCPIYTNGKILVGTVQYRIRMRLPISPFLQWNHAKQIMNKGSSHDPFAINQRKKLSINIERADGLKNVGNTFVYFNIQNQDFFTQPEMGSSPFWDFHREIDVIIDEQFSAYLKENFIQFTVFDDDKQVNEDVVGIAKANLTHLLESQQPLQLNLEIQNTNFQVVGHLKIKANWV